MIFGEPFQGKALEQLQLFLTACDLTYDPSIEYSVALVENDKIIAAGSLDGNTIKCVAVDKAHQGEDLTGQIMTALLNRAAQRGMGQLMLYTKPHNEYLFAPFGFHRIIRTSDCLLMENRRDGLAKFLAAIEKVDARKIGCIVANCNPFTKGHRYLIETAAAQCEHVYVFILSEDKGMFSSQERLAMAQDGVKDLKNVSVHSSGAYMVSAATFPTYFIKDKARAGDIRCEADLRLFGEKIAPALGITHRFVGSEPECAVTKQYNEKMHLLLPEYGLQVVEIPRREAEGQVISASAARKLITEEDWATLQTFLPDCVIDRIRMKKGE